MYINYVLSYSIAGLLNSLASRNNTLFFVRFHLHLDLDLQFDLHLGIHFHLGLDLDSINHNNVHSCKAWHAQAARGVCALRALVFIVDIYHSVVDIYINSLCLQWTFTKSPHSRPNYGGYLLTPLIADPLWWIFTKFQASQWTFSSHTLCSAQYLNEKQVKGRLVK